jgi:hypothetical protein
MTGQEFFRAVSNGKEDILQLLVRLLKETETPYCVIGGLAVNAYVEPVVSLDLDVVVATESSPRLCSAAELAGLKSEVFEHNRSALSAVPQACRGTERARPDDEGGHPGGRSTR